MGDAATQNFAFRAPVYGARNLFDDYGERQIPPPRYAHRRNDKFKEGSRILNETDSTCDTRHTRVGL